MKNIKKEYEGIFGRWIAKLNKTDISTGNKCKICGENDVPGNSKYCGECVAYVSCVSCNAVTKVTKNSYPFKKSESLEHYLFSNPYICNSCKKLYGKKSKNANFISNLSNRELIQFKASIFDYACAKHGNSYGYADADGEISCSSCLEDTFYGKGWKSDYCKSCRAYTPFAYDRKEKEWCCYSCELKYSKKLSYCSNHKAFIKHAAGTCEACIHESQYNSEKHHNRPGSCFIHGKCSISLNGECLECSKSSFSKYRKILSYVKSEFGIKGKIVSLNYGTRGWKSEFEKYLVENNIGKFVYCTLTKEGIISVVGQSGSKLVQVSGSDVWFSRKATTSFILQDMGLHQNKHKIIVWYDKKWNNSNIGKWEKDIGDSILDKFGIVNTYSHRK